VPDKTHVEEHDLVTDGDVIVGSQSTVEFGVRGQNIIAGEQVEFGGHIEAGGDCRLDMWCTVADDVLAGEDAYVGERVQVGGELRVAGNLDIGDEVEIAEGFDANGWIVIRNPMPTIVYLFVYLSHLLRAGDDGVAEQLAATFVAESVAPMIVPQNARLGDDTWEVSTPAQIGDDCRLHGNIRAAALTVGRDNEIFGSLRAAEGVTVGAGTRVTGNVTTRDGTVRVGPGAVVRGDIAGEHVEVHTDATIEGIIRANKKTSVISKPVTDATPVSETPTAGDTGEVGGEIKTETAAGTEAEAESKTEADKSGPEPAIRPLRSTGDASQG
jgi:Predicted acyltransferase